MQSTLVTKRLKLRPYSLSDGPRVQELAGDSRIAETTLNVPHPYKDGMAEKWIEGHASDYAEMTAVNCAVCLIENDEVIGTVSLSIDNRNRKAELGYWIGVEYWGKGYCTEAAGELIGFAAEKLSIHKITSRHMSHNPASGRVMQKLGMRHEGTLIKDVIKDGKRVDLEVYGLLL